MVSRYIKIHDDIRESIENGLWKVGDKIPSERELTDIFKASRMTIRQAVLLLVEENILERKIGSGTYVAKEKYQDKLDGIMSFTELIKLAGKTSKSKIVSYHIANASLSEKKHLKLQDEVNVLKIERIRYAGDEPIAFEVVVIPETLIKNINKKQLTGSLYEALNKGQNITVSKAIQTVTAIVATEKIAEYLNIKRTSPILMLRQVSFDQNNHPFEYVRTQYVGSKFEFYIEH